MRTEYSQDANRLLLSELASVVNYEAMADGTPHPLDIQGYDRHIKIDFGWGIRVRLIEKAHFKDFTVDFKEWNYENNDPHYYYFYAYVYAPDVKHQIDFYMIFDYRKLKQLVHLGIIKPSSTPRNKGHGMVAFQGFYITDLFKHKLIISYDGTQEMLDLFGLPKRVETRIDRFS